MEPDLRTMPLADALDVARRIEDLTTSPGWAIIEAQIEAKRTALTKQMLNPSIPSLEKFAALAAEIRGLTALGDIPNQILATVQEREREAESKVA